SIPLVAISYFLRGFGFPLFAFAFLVWVNAVVRKERNGAAVGWFYVMFTGGLPTLGSLVAVFMIPAFGGGHSGETWTMIASTSVGRVWVLLLIAACCGGHSGVPWTMVASSCVVAIGFLIAWFGVRERHGSIWLVPQEESPALVIFSDAGLSSWGASRMLPWRK